MLWSAVVRLDFVYYRNNCYTRDGDLKIADAAATVQAQDRLDLAFVYFGTIDVAGHVYGWMSDEYLRQIEHVDAAVGRVLDITRAEDTVHLLADHGGHARTHGTEQPADMTVPWLIAGPNIRRGYQIRSDVSLLDTAPTLAHVLDVSVSDQWEGQRVAEVFVD